MANHFVLVLGLWSMFVTLATYYGVALLRHWAAQRLLDVPNERSSHHQPTPRGGGLAMVVCTLLGLWLAFCWPGWDLPWRSSLAYTLGAVLVAAVSWLDDLWSLPNRLRFLTHAGGALCIILGIGYWQQLTLPFMGIVDLGWWGMLLTFLWIAGLTNAYNFMDGIDGIAGGQAVLAGVTWIGLGWWSGTPLVSLLGTLLAGSSLGFLGHNWPPARMFMGDVGSAFLGYTFAALAVMGHVSQPRLALAGILVVWPFVFDTTFTLLRRLRHRENIFAAHRSHLYQRLIIAGYSHCSVTLMYMVLALSGVLLASAWSLPIMGGNWPVCGILTLLCLGLWRVVIRAERKSLPLGVESRRGDIRL